MNYSICHFGKSAHLFPLRWSHAADDLQNTYDNLTGDVLISAGVIAYLGAFTAGFRQECTKEWSKLCKVVLVYCFISRTHIVFF